jgi:uncharacterized repeat protein (TIGR03837 family)
MLWDIFCKVVDNHGDIGVCWRLSVELARRGHELRLRVDDATALQWMAPQGHPRVQVLPWASKAQPQPGDAVIEAFGCELPEDFQAAMAATARVAGRAPTWINLEYLTAESFAERSHGLPSPILAGPAAGLTKHFFYPGFTPGTGGLLREQDLPERQARFDRGAWLRAHGIDPAEDAQHVSLFCYEPAALDDLLAAWSGAPYRTRLLVTAGRAAAAVRAALMRAQAHAPAASGSQLSITWLPLLAQRDFDHLLWSCDLNFVRGEDSLVRALWAGKPLVWQIYPQHDDAHHGKLTAFLDWLEAPAGLREFHRTWNGIAMHSSAPDAAAWSSCFGRARERLLLQDDLVTQLLRFVASKVERP